MDKIDFDQIDICLSDAIGILRGIQARLKTTDTKTPKTTPEKKLRGRPKKATIEANNGSLNMDI